METNGFKHVDRAERPSKKVSLHGLGFLQVQLSDQLRIHVWHPDLPRRLCFEHSSVHNHRFGFQSTVLAGSVLNHVVAPILVAGIDKGDQYYLYEHPWFPATGGPWRFVHVSSMSYEAGQSYSMLPYVYHETAIVGHGRAATLMRKTEEHEAPAHSACRVGVRPDEAFDRFQMSDDDMWAVVRDVLG